MGKRCCHCRETKPLADFYDNRNRADGKDIRCKRCHCASSSRNRDKRRESERFHNRRLFARSPQEYVETRSVPEPNSGCWLWIGSLNRAGYGTGCVKSRALLAHRFSWTAYVGPIPDGMLICHKCDTPACVNPAHLFLGDHMDNMRDAAQKGRSARLIKDSIPAELAAKVTADPRRRDKVAAEYGLDYLTIRRIKARAQRAAAREPR